MWLGLILGLTAAAILMGLRFQRSSRRLLLASQPAQ
jgi:MATE family multidrug resistance protein